MCMGLQRMLCVCVVHPHGDLHGDPHGSLHGNLHGCGAPAGVWACARRARRTARTHHAHSTRTARARHARARTLSASSTMKPPMMALVVAMAGTILPAISLTSQRDLRGMWKTCERRFEAEVTRSSACGSSLSNSSPPPSLAKSCARSVCMVSMAPRKTCEHTVDRCARVRVHGTRLDARMARASTGIRLGQGGRGRRGGPLRSPRGSTRADRPRRGRRHRAASSPPAAAPRASHAPSTTSPGRGGGGDGGGAWACVTVRGRA